MVTVVVRYGVVPVCNLAPDITGPLISWVQGEATVPSNLGDEFDTNPFLRPSDPSIRKKLGKQSSLALCYTLPTEPGIHMLRYR